MTISTPYYLKRTVATAIEPELYKKFAAIADKHKVTVAAYLRATIVDVVDEEYKEEDANGGDIPGVLPAS